MKCLLILLLSVCSLTLKADSENIYELLSKSRSSIRFDNYNLSQKQTVLNQAKLVLDEIFPHKETKLKNFGENSNWTPQFEAIQKDLSSISTKEFHKRMAKVFVNLQDLHTSYYYPKPHACYSSFLPFKVKSVRSQKGKEVPVITMLSDKSEITDIVGPLAGLRLELGAEVLAVDGVNVQAAIKKLESISPGANPDAIKLRAHGYLTFRSHRSNPVMAKNHVVFKLKSSTGQIYETKIPWITRRKSDCLSSNKSSEDFVEEDLDEVNEVHKIFSSKKVEDHKSLNVIGEWNDTNESILKYKMIKDGDRLTGVIKLASFKPINLSWRDLLKKMSRLLSNELSNTDNLIIDLRDNGGGYIALAEGMLQLLTSTRTTPSTFRLRNTNINLEYFRSISWDSNFYELLRAAQDNGELLTEAIPFAWTYNYLNRAYFKPFGVLTNANCYSSCDMFSAIVQDHGAGVIFGEDSTTGAGGANNVNYNSFRQNLKNPNSLNFIKLPGKQNLGFSFRQYVRQGKSVGHLLEDRGVLTDVKVARTIEDVNTESTSQYKKISKYLTRK